MPSLRLILMGSPEFPIPSFAALAEAGHEIVAVYCQPPKPAGRGHHLTPSPVQSWAEARGYPLRTPKSLKTPEVQAQFAADRADAAIVAAYGLLLPKAVLAAPRLGCLNIHASLLPRWRGASPIAMAILEGDQKSGITLMQMEEGLDTGPILMQEEIPIDDNERAGNLHDRLMQLAARMIAPGIAAWTAGTLRPRPQPAEGVLYAPKISRAHAYLNPLLPAAVLERAIRAFDPWPGAWLLLAGERLRIWDAEIVPGRGLAPGVVSPDLIMSCGDGQALRLIRLQRPGGRAMPVAEFLNGFRPLADLRVPTDGAADTIRTLPA